MANNIFLKMMLVLYQNFEKQLFDPGDQVPKFEKSLTKNLKVNYSIAVNKTSALHIACLALGLSWKGDYLWTSPISFVAYQQLWEI